jgi:biopolymer transport protein ExbD
MATIDVGGASSRRELNRELTLVPFIDFLLCIVAFLLVTAVWSEMARLDARASVPGQPSLLPADAPTPELHVHLSRGDRFVLEWRQGNIVLTEDSVPRKSMTAPDDGVVRFPTLAAEVTKAWEKSGVHRAPADPRRDRAVLHTGNAALFEDIVAGMDAIHATSREVSGIGKAPAFDVVFAVD